MKQIGLTLFVYFCYIITGFSQHYVITGNVVDKEGEVVIGAAIVLKNNRNIGTLTDKYGNFYLRVNQPNVTLEVTHLSYKSRAIQLHLKGDTTLSIALDRRTQDLEAVEVKAKRNIYNVNNISQLNVPVYIVNDLPVIAGEKDILKGIQLFTGIQPGLEGSAQVNVRGGNPNQNLYLIDDMPVFYISHLFGFFSVINSSAVRDVQIYKGFIPAKYDNFSSSVIDVTMNEGSLQKRHISFETGLFSVKTNFSGYLVKDKVSATLSIRKSYIDYILKQLTISKIDNSSTFQTLGFYDVNFKTRILLNRSNKLYISFLKTGDYLVSKYKNLDYDYTISLPVFDDYNSQIDFGNNGVSIRLLSRVNKNLFTSNVLGFVYYDYNNYKQVKRRIKDFHDSIYVSDLEQYIYNPEIGFFINQNGQNISRFIYKNNSTWKVNNNTEIDFGVNVGSNNTQMISNLSNVVLDTISYENNSDKLYRNNILSPYLSINYKISCFSFNLGSVASFLFNPSYNGFYFSPRLKLGFRPWDAFSIQGSYVSVYQFDHMLTSSALALPSNLLIPTLEGMKPINTNIYDFSLSQDFGKFSFVFSVYYKTFENLLHYRMGVEDTWKDNWSAIIEVGNGRAYGLEFSLNKVVGRFKGWINYQYTHSYRKFEYLNNGKEFLYTYDRPHIVNLVLDYHINKRLNISGLWTYYSGHLVTMPLYLYFASQSGQLPLTWRILSYYGELNNVRIPDYHRLDINLQYHKPGGHSYWTVGVYNLYNRLNPILLEPAINNHFNGLALFPIMPYVSYRWQMEWK